VCDKPLCASLQSFVMSLPDAGLFLFVCCSYLVKFIKSYQE
jgi:hypothetical protein